MEKKIKNGLRNRGSKKINKKTRLLFLFLLLFGLAFAGEFVVAAYNYYTFKCKGRLTTGYVVDKSVTLRHNNSSASGRNLSNSGSNMTSPVVSFITSEGDEVLFNYSFTSMTHDYLVGTEVPVIYDPANPAEANIANFELGFHSIFGGIGVLFIVLSFLSIYKWPNAF